MIPFGKRPRTLPSVLSQEEVVRLLAATPAGRVSTLKSLEHGRNTQIEVCFEFVSTLLDDLAAALDGASLRRHVRDPVRPRRKSVKLPASPLGSQSQTRLIHRVAKARAGH